jgi:hypothetical protein
MIEISIQTGIMLYIIFTMYLIISLIWGIINYKTMIITIPGFIITILIVQVYMQDWYSLFKECSLWGAAVIILSVLYFVRPDGSTLE